MEDLEVIIDAAIGYWSQRVHRLRSCPYLKEGRTRSSGPG